MPGYTITATQKHLGYWAMGYDHFDFSPSTILPLTLFRQGSTILSDWWPGTGSTRWRRNYLISRRRNVCRDALR